MGLISRLPAVRLGRWLLARAADTILGPVEEIEYPRTVARPTVSRDST